jgi:hypothetical protein
MSGYRNESMKIRPLPSQRDPKRQEVIFLDNQLLSSDFALFFAFRQLTKIEILNAKIMSNLQE